MEEYSKEDLKTIAIGQRGVCIMFLIGIVLRVLTALSLPTSEFIVFIVRFFPLLHVVWFVALIYFLWKLTRGLHTNIFLSIVFCIVAFWGIIGLIFLLIEIVSATNVLKKAGLHVGLLGVPKSEIDQL